MRHPRVDRASGLSVRLKLTLSYAAFLMLAGALLLPREALVFICKSYTDLKRAAKEYGVSMEMLTYRLQVTAVQKQLQRAARYRHRT